MTIEAFIVAYLNSVITDAPTSGDVPHPRPAQFITVEKTGERNRNHIPKAEIAVQSWAASRADAMALNERVKAAMLDMVSELEIMRCALNAEYNFPSEETKCPRYQSVFEIVYNRNLTA